MLLCFYENFIFCVCLDRGFQISEKVGEFLDHDKPIISLDERLRELTGEPLPEYSPHSPVKSSKVILFFLNNFLGC